MHTWHDAIPEAFPNWPAKHGLHSTAPGVDETFPGAHCVQFGEPVALEYRPASHGMHSVAPEAAYCPAKHLLQIMSTVVTLRSTENSPGLHTFFFVQLL